MWALKNQKQTGFTIVELIVVITVIAILAGIVTIGYGAWRKDIAVSSVKSDLNAALSTMEDARTFSKDGYPTSLPASFTSTQGVTVSYMFGTAKGFCIEATSSSAPGTVYRIDTTKGEKNPVEGACDLPVTTKPATLTGGLGYATATDTTTGRIYYSQGYPLSGGNVYVLEPAGMTSSLYQSFSTTVKDLVVRNGYLYAALATEVRRVNLSNGTVDSLPMSGAVNDLQSLYFDGNTTLYMGGARDFYRLDLTTGTLQSLYYSGSNPYFTSMVKVGNKMYLTGISYYLYAYDFTTNQMTPMSRPSGTANGNVVLLDNKLYTTIDGNLTSYDIATNTWTSIRPVKKTSCASGGDMEVVNQRIAYLGFTDLADTSCSLPEHGWSLYSIKL